MKKILKNIFFSFVWVAVIVFAIDITTKWLTQSNVAVNQEIEVIPNFFYITLVHNTGVAFSMGKDILAFRIIFICISLAASIFIPIFFVKKYNKLTTFYRLALMLILGGCVGNLIDRAFYWEATVGFSGVIDMLLFKFGALGNFAVFNVADAAVVIGVLILVIILIVEEVKNTIKNKKEGKYDLPPEEYEKRKKQLEEAEKALEDENTK